MNKIDGGYTHRGWTISRTHEGWEMTHPDQQTPLTSPTLVSARHRIDAKQRLKAANELLDSLFSGSVDSYFGNSRK